MTSQMDDKTISEVLQKAQKGLSREIFSLSAIRSFFSRIQQKVALH